MPTARESVCSFEIAEIEDKMSELQPLHPNSEATCITEPPGLWCVFGHVGNADDAHQIRHTHDQGAIA